MAVGDDRDPDGFTVVRHGYDRTQVRQRVAELAESAETASAERDEAREQLAELHGELEIARREVAALTERLEAQADEESATRLLAVAKSQAAEVTSRARVAADQMWASAKAQVEQMTTEAERRREAIDKDAEQDRIRIDREFSESMSTKREALRSELEEAKAACERAVTERLAEATAEAQRRVDSVTDHVQRLTSVRDQLSERLRDTKELLDLSTSLLEPVEGEAATVPDEPAAAGHDDVSASNAATKRTVPPQRVSKRQTAASG